MKVYIVWALSNDTHEIYGVFSTLKLAKEAADNCTENWRDLSIYSVELDKLQEDATWGDFEE